MTINCPKTEVVSQLNHVPKATGFLEAGVFYNTFCGGINRCAVDGLQINTLVKCLLRQNRVLAVAIAGRNIGFFQREATGNLV